MKSIFIVRHGKYSFDGEGDFPLNTAGVEQIAKLAPLLIQATGESTSWALLTSTAKRASQSADVISRFIGVSPEAHELLFSDDEVPEDLERAFELLGQQQAESVVIVTHFEYAQFLPDFIGRQMLGVTNFPRKEIQKGQAWYINCQRGTCTLLP